MRRKGFITGEMALAMIIAMILLSGAAYSGFSALQDAKTADARSHAAAIAAVISQYKVEVGVYPTSLAKLTQKEGDYKPWRATIPKDPWERDYIYQYDEDGFVVYSRGRDGKAHGSTIQSVSKGDIGFIGK